MVSVRLTPWLSLSVCLLPSRHPGITGGLVKGALSVAASAYKALFTGQPGPVQVSPLFTSYSTVNNSIQGHPFCNLRGLLYHINMVVETSNWNATIVRLL